MPTVAISTLGCKLNQFESEAVLAQFRSAGYTAIDNAATADVCVVNTCAVTGAAERKARQLLRSHHRRNPNARLLAVGCMAERAPDVLANIAGVTSVIGNHEKQHILDFLTADATAVPRVFIGETARAAQFTDAVPVKGLRGRTRGFLKVQDGCSQHCTYCIIPRLRGRGRSLPAAAVVERARVLAANGFAEVVITGVALGTYGFDLGLTDGLTELIAALHAVPEISRIRLGSIEPWAITDRFLETLADSPTICPHLHIPLQSGEDGVLRRMNRRYTVNRMRRMFDKALALRTDWGFGSDIIAGFPGETDASFATTKRFLLESPLTYLHVFPFSARPGTPALKLPDAVPEGVRRERAAELRCLDAQLRARFSRRQIGTKHRVLFEQRLSGDFMAGHTPNYLDVFAPTAAEYVGTIQQVRITHMHPDGVAGEIIA